MDLEFSNYFHPGNTPLDIFGHHLFSDWDREEWNNFYNFMVICQQTYLKDGIKVIENSLKNKCKQNRNHYTEEYLDWWKEYCINGSAEWKLFNTLDNDFLRVNDFEKINYSSIRFKKGLEYASDIFGVKLGKRLSMQNGNKPEFRVVDVANILGNIEWG
jgi:hypothetical protein